MILVIVITPIGIVITNILIIVILIVIVNIICLPDMLGLFYSVSNVISIRHVVASFHSNDPRKLRF